MLTFVNKYRVTNGNSIIVSKISLSEWSYIDLLNLQTSEDSRSLVYIGVFNRRVQIQLLFINVW